MKTTRTMSGLRTRLSLCAAIAIAVAVAVPTTAGAADAILYEISETVKEDPRKRMVEDATLHGKANAGVPACPQALVDRYMPGATACTVTLRGWDEVDNRTGLGTFGGDWIGLIDADNPFDGPELVIISGSFQGHMDSSPIRLAGLPYGTTSGKLTVSSARQVTVPTGDFEFTAVFRMPFDGRVRVDGPGSPTLRDKLCSAAPTPNPYLGGRDLVYLDTTDGKPNGKCIDIRPHELMLDMPMVRFEVTFK